MSIRNNPPGIDICVIQKSDLFSFAEELVISKFGDRDISAQAAAQVLGVSVSTLNRWIEADVLRPVSQRGEKREERKFNLAYLLSLDLKQIKTDYRYLNK